MNRLLFTATLACDWLKENLDTVALIALMILSNLHLTGAGPIESTVYMPDATISGQLRRLVTFTFTHVSWYHLVLDSTAFLLLYSCLSDKRKVIRLQHFIICSAASLISVILLDPRVETHGYCGLSGTTHGIAGIISLEMLRSDKLRTTGLILGLLLFVKCTAEFAVGAPLFGTIHDTLVGTPLLISHAGGAVGGLISYFSVGALNNAHSRKAASSKIVIALMILFTLIPEKGFAAQEKRTALVIGNSHYTSSPLVNPENDAEDIAVVLERLGFYVTAIMNSTRRDMENAIRQFGSALKKTGGAGLFYYAGHAVQVNGGNFLIPVDAEIHEESDIIFESVDAGRILSAMNSAGNPLNIVILDSCRDNPFKRGYRSSVRGLARMDAPKGTLIAYSTSPGSVALDGDGRNSPYTSLLLKFMVKQNIPVEQMFKYVRRSLDARTYGRQTPWESTSLTGDFYFNPVNNSSYSSGNRPATAISGNKPLLSARDGAIDYSMPSKKIKYSSGETDKTTLKISVINMTGYDISGFDLQCGNISVSEKIAYHPEAQPEIVYSGYAAHGKSVVSVGAAYEYTKDDMNSNQPSVSVESAQFRAESILTLKPDKSNTLLIYIKLKQAGFWETRDNEVVEIEFVSG